MPKQTKTEMATTGLAVLGLLSMGERSGYDLLKMAQQSISSFWNPAKSHVYSELKRLVKEGFATEREVAQTGRPDKRMYEITEAGRKELLRWLGEPILEPEESGRNPFLLKIFFSYHLPPTELAQRLREYHGVLKAELEQLQGLQASLAQDRELFFPYLTVKAAVARRRAMIQWAEDALVELGRL